MDLFINFVFPINNNNQWQCFENVFKEWKCKHQQDQGNYPLFYKLKKYLVLLLLLSLATSRKSPIEWNNNNNNDNYYCQNPHLWLQLLPWICMGPPFQAKYFPICCCCCCFSKGSKLAMGWLWSSWFWLYFGHFGHIGRSQQWYNWKSVLFCTYGYDTVMTLFNFFLSFLNY